MKKYFFMSLLLVVFCVFAQHTHHPKPAEPKDYHATEPLLNELIHTKLEVSFNFKTEQLFGKETLTATPYFYPQNTLVLDAKAMDIHTVKVNGKSTTFDYSKDILTINLDKTYKKGEKYEVFIDYTANPNKVTQGGSAAISDAKGLYFIDPRDEDPEKPTQIWTQGETEASSCWFPTIDQPNAKTSQEILITVPNQYVTLSNGLLVKEKKNNDGTRTDHWKFDQKHTPYLFFMGIGEYAIVKDSWKGKEVNYYVEKEYEDAAKEIFPHTPEMLTFFSDILNYEYPWDKYSQIICRDYVSGAMENTTAVIFGDFVQQPKGALIDDNSRNEAIVAHEMFHHWFGDLVTTESWSNLTLNESFANYSEYLWIEYKHGRDAAEYHRHNEFFGYNTPENRHKKLVRFEYSDKEDMFDGVSYNKGGLILHMLRNYLGDEAFFKGLNHYLKAHEYGTAEAHQLRISLEAVSGLDLNWFFNQWYFGEGHPELTIDKTYDDSSKKLKISIKQTQDGPLFQFPFAIDTYENGKATRHHIWVNAEKSSSFEFPVSKQPDLVLTNADQVLLCEIKEEKTDKDFANQYQWSKEFKDRNAALDYFIEKKGSKEAEQILKEALNDPFYILKLKALEGIEENKVKPMASDLEKIANQADKTLVKASAISLLGTLKDKKYMPLYEKAISSESFAMQSAGLLAINFIDPAKADSYMSKMDKRAIGTDYAMEKLDDWIKENKTEYSFLFADVAPFYAFAPNQEEAKKAQKAFEWIMQNGDAKANDQIIGLYGQILKQYASNASAIQNIKYLIQSAIDAKKKAPSTPVIEDQLKRLEALLK